MKKITVFMFSLVLILGLAGVASAVSTTWEDEIDFDPDILIPPAHGYFHNIADGANGFESWWMNPGEGDDLIFSYDLEVAIYDDDLGTTTTFRNKTKIQPDGNEIAKILTLGGVYRYDFELESDIYSSEDTWSLFGILDILEDGTLNVLITSLKGDFYLDRSKLTVYGDNGTAPVPEPATLLLLGTGLLGVVGANRKRLGKKK